MHSCDQRSQYTTGPAKAITRNSKCLRLSGLHAQTKIIRRPWSCDEGLRMVPRALNRTTHSLEGFQMHSRPRSCGGTSDVHRVVLSSERQGAFR